MHRSHVAPSIDVSLIWVGTKQNFAQREQDHVVKGFICQRGDRRRASAVRSCRHFKLLAVSPNKIGEAARTVIYDGNQLVWAAAQQDFFRLAAAAGQCFSSCPYTEMNWMGGKAKQVSAKPTAKEKAQQQQRCQ